ncbi:MAG TPA: thioesterase family protein [Panacibacter sp.]|nr:thioesterase family protein [Panacibacter sp.]
MERVNVKLPAVFSFAVNITIRITDLNYGWHVGNDTFLSLMQEARQQFLNKHGYGELSFAGYSLMLADASIEYKRELKYGDIVKISVASGGFDKYGFDLYYKMEIITGTENVLACKAKTGMLCYDTKNRKLLSVPDEAIQRLLQH